MHMVAVMSCYIAGGRSQELLHACVRSQELLHAVGWSQELPHAGGRSYELLNCRQEEPGAVTCRW
jgi:hypothetical protein